MVLFVDIRGFRALVDVAGLSKLADSSDSPHACYMSQGNA